MYVYVVRMCNARRTAHKGGVKKEKNGRRLTGRDGEKEGKQHEMMSKDIFEQEFFRLEEVGGE